MKKIIGLLLLLLFFFPCFAETIIYGNAKDYANSTIIFYKYSDRITYQKEKLFELEIDANGDFLDLIYPQMPASSETTYKGMLMYTYTIKTKRVNISPQIFAMSDVYVDFKDGETDFGYKNDFNFKIMFFFFHDLH